MWSDVRNIARWILYLLFIFTLCYSCAYMAFNLFPLGSMQRIYACACNPMWFLYIYVRIMQVTGTYTRRQPHIIQNHIHITIIFFWINYYDSNLGSVKRSCYTKHKCKARYQIINDLRALVAGCWSSVNLFFHIMGMHAW